jgi:hypothetical protein
MVLGSLVVSMTVVGGAMALLTGDLDRGASARAAAAVTPDADEARVAPSSAEDRSWSGIVIHHSASTSGSMRSLTERQRAQGILGLGYHFVIGNGSGESDGRVLEGPRWGEQLPGAHVEGPRSYEFNQGTIGICIVGDGDRKPFTERQIVALVELVQSLQQRYNIDPGQVYLHRDVAAVASPGRLFPEAMFRQNLLTPGS